MTAISTILPSNSSHDEKDSVHIYEPWKFNNDNEASESSTTPDRTSDGTANDDALLLRTSSVMKATFHNPEIIRNELRSIWAEILHDDPSLFSNEDVFFEVGGDSVSVQKLITAAKGRGIYLTTEQIFMHASLADMAEVAGFVDTGVEPDGEGHTTAPKAFSSFNNDVSTEDVVEAIAIKCSIPTGDIENAYLCSPMQESLLAEFDGDRNLYVRQFVFKLAADVPLNRFRQAWEDTVDANPVLRTRICHLSGGRGHVQAVLRNDGQWNTLHVDLDQFLESDATDHMLPGGSFFRYTILIDEDGKGNMRRHFVWTVHHALCDAASIIEIFEDVARRFLGKPGPDRAPFESFIQSSAVMPQLSSEREFWRRALSGINPTPYPPIPQDPGFRADPSFVLERSLTLDLLPPHGVTRALLLRAAWAILLSHYNGTEDVGFGAINNGRTAAVPGVSQMTGPTINLVPIALRVDPSESVASFLSRVRVQAAEMIPFEHSGMSRIRKHLAGKQSTAADFQTLFVVHPMSFVDAIAPAMQTLGLQYVDEMGKKEQHPYPLVLTLTLSTGTAVTMAIQHDERVVSTQQALRMVHHFQVVLSQLSKAMKETNLGSISPFSDHDLRQIRRWNKFTPPAEETCIHHLFQKQVVRRPDAIAVCSLDKTLTYLDVDMYSSSLAVQLLELGVRIGTFVGVCFEKSIWTVVAILAVFKAGGVYVPIDPAHPRNRIEEIVRTVGVEVALASLDGTEVLQSLVSRTITVNDCSVMPWRGINPPSNSLPSTIAYLLFTSGSTGKPKGLLMSHSAICTSIIYHGAAFAAGPHWRALQFAAHTFDLSIGEFFTTLAHGGCICVPSEHDRLNDLAGAIRSLRANTLMVVPTVANLLFPKHVPTLKTIVLAGEPITKETVLRWADSVDLTCAYGPSETAVWCSGNLRVSADAHPGNIGRSIGATMWIVNPDNFHQLSAVGCVGEIVISGGLLGGGYFADQATTDAAFVPAPGWMREMESNVSSYNMLYRSGDLARYNTDGTFQIVGRRDTQVKLRGFRIELGEIENQTMATGMVTAALAALPTAGPCARQIVAVVCFTKPDLKSHSGVEIVASREGQAVLEGLKASLSLSLPEYMIPSVWVILEKMPLLISGKIDRKSIKTWIENMDYNMYRDLEGGDAGDVVEIVPGSLADRLRHLWSEALNVPAEHIGKNSSFIALGGDSIAAIHIVSQAKSLGLSVTVRGLVNTKTLGNLVTLVKQSSHSTTRPGLNTTQASQMTENIPPAYEQLLQSRLSGRQSVQVEYVYTLAPFQREIMKARKVNPSVFLLSWQMDIFSLTSQPISLERLARAWRGVVQRYPILRSLFLQDPTGSLPAVQVVLAKDAQPEIAISSASTEEAEPDFATTHTPDVDECFLPHRAHFVRHGERYFVHLELDHLVIDGWSLKIIKEAFLTAYDDEAYIPDEPPSYSAFVAAHYPERVKADDGYWASALRGQRPCLLSLPASSSETTPGQQSLEKAIFYLPEIKAHSVRSFSTQYSITPASIFDAAWAQTLSVYMRSPDVAFEYVVSGRDEDVPGVFNIVGPLINVLPYHVEGISTGNDPKELAHLAQKMQEQRTRDSLHTSSNVREVIENELKVEKLCNTALNFQRRPTAVENEKLRIDDDLRKSRDPWHFDVLVRVMHITDDDTFKPSFEFDPLFFDGDMMKEVADDFRRRVNAILV